MAWNQLAKKTDFHNTGNVEDSLGLKYTNNGDGSITISGTASGTGNADFYFTPNNKIPCVNGHKYITDGHSYAYGSGTGGQHYAFVATSDGYVRLWNRSEVTSGKSYNITYYPMIHDLTQMLGTAIADRAYALEQATAGSGIAWLKSMGFFTQNYYPYDTGTLKSVEGLQSHDMTGFNQWDEEWELGTYNGNTGEKISVNNCIRSKNAINCFPDTYYYFPYLTGGIYLFFYDFNGNYIGTVSIGGGILQIPSGVHQIRFRLDAVYGTTYNHNICINISDPGKNGTYEPYQKHSYPLDSDLTLRGIPKLDANNKLYYDGDTYEADGSVTRRYGIVDLGTLEWSQRDFTGHILFYATVNGAKMGGNCVCTRYDKVAANIVANYPTDKIMALAYIFSDNSINIRDYSYTNASDLKVSLNGVYLVYELATPTTETADPFQTPQICDKAGTEEYVTTGIVPVGHLTKYPEDLRAKIEGLPWNLSMIAPIENGTTASQAYTTGQYFLHNDLFCKALTSIASGATFTLNTNYAVTTVAAELFAALNS